MILADTDALIDYTNGVDPVRSQIRSLLNLGLLQTTAITCFELLSGARENKRGDAVRALIEGLDVLPLDKFACETAARVRRDLEASGQSIGMGDSLIAGIALAHDLPLLTCNQRHFRRVPGLRLA